jgi:hypothetical protein
MEQKNRESQRKTGKIMKQRTLVAKDKRSGDDCREE